MSTTPEDLASFPNRYAVEREIEAAENPAPGTMHLNDGHERVCLPGGTLRRMLAVIDQLAAMASSAQQGEPVAVAREARAEWFAIAMNAAAYLEDAAACLRDKDAKRAAEGAAKHVREKCNTLWFAQDDTRPTAPAEPADLRAFLDAAAGEGLVLAGVDAADLCVSLFPEHYAALQANDTTKGK